MALRLLRDGIMPSLATFAPERFIPIAEETGLIREIDRFVLQKAVEDIGALMEAGLNVILAVNISAATTEDSFLVDEVEKLLRRYRI